MESDFRMPFIVQTSSIWEWLCNAITLSHVPVWTSLLTFGAACCRTKQVSCKRPANSSVIAAVIKKTTGLKAFCKKMLQPDTVNPRVKLNPKITINKSSQGLSHAQFPALSAWHSQTHTLNPLDLSAHSVLTSLCDK